MEEYMLLTNYLNRERININNELNINENDTKLLFDLKQFIDKYANDVRSVDLIELKNILSDIEINNDLVNSYIGQINMVTSCYDLVFNPNIPNEGIKKKMLDDYNFVGRLLVNYYKIRKSVYEEKRDSLNKKLELIDKYFNMFSDGSFYVLKENMEEFIDFVTSLDIPREDVLRIIAKVSENSIEYYLNENSKNVEIEQQLESIPDNKEQKQIETKEEIISKNVESIQEEIKIEKTEEEINLSNLLAKIKNIISNNSKYLSEYAEYRKYFHSGKTDDLKMNRYGSIIYYLNQNDIEGARFAAYPDFVVERLQLTLALAELQGLLNYALEDKVVGGEAKELSIMIEEAFKKYEESKKRYDEVVSEQYVEEDSKELSNFFKNSKNIMLLLKNKDGEFCIDKDIEHYSNVNEREVVSQEIRNVLSKFRDIPYIDSEGYSGLATTYGGAKDKKGNRICELYDFDDKGRRIRDDSKPFRFRGTDQGRTGYIIINICKENRIKLFNLYGNPDILKGGNVILFTGVIFCNAGHDDYSMLNSNINNNKHYINYLNAIFSDPNTDVELLSEIINDSMEKCHSYLNDSNGRERSI